MNSRKRSNDSFKARLCEQIGWNGRATHLITGLTCLGWSSRDYNGRYFSVICKRCKTVTIKCEYELRRFGTIEIKRMIADAIDKWETRKR